MRPFRFAVVASHAGSAEKWREIARRAESLGYDVLLVVDHTGRQLAPVPALAAAAEATRTLRLGAFVFANDYRNPVLLAKEVATLDLLSDGRFELGVGAGWATRDYERLGIRYDAPSVRVSRMLEAVRLMKRLFREESVDFTGVHYTVRGARLEPRPARMPPLLIGGGGRRMLAIAAREADIVGLLPQVSASGRFRVREVTGAATAGKVERLRRIAGARFADLELNINVLDVHVARGSLGAHIAARLKGALAGLVDTPYVLYGSVRSLEERLLERRERHAISYYTIPGRVMDAFAPVAAALRGR